MFTKIKRLISKPKYKITKSNKQYVTTNIVSFHDLAGKDIFFEIKTNGNSTLVTLHDKDKKLTFNLDQEKAILMGALLQEYGITGKFPDLGE